MWFVRENVPYLINCSISASTGNENHSNVKGIMLCMCILAFTYFFISSPPGHGGEHPADKRPHTGRLNCFGFAD